MPKDTDREINDFAIADDSESSQGEESEDIDSDTTTEAAPADKDAILSYITTTGEQIEVVRLSDERTHATNTPTANDYYPVEDTANNVYRAFHQKDDNVGVVLTTAEDDRVVVAAMSSQINFTGQLAKSSLTFNTNLSKGVPNVAPVSKLWKTIFGDKMMLSTVHANQIIAQRNESVKQRRREKTKAKRTATKAAAEGNAPKKAKIDSASKTEPVAAPDDTVKPVAPSLGGKPTLSGKSMQLTITGLDNKDVTAIASFVTTL